MGSQSKVNLIPYNPTKAGDRFDFKSPTDAQVLVTCVVLLFVLATSFYVFQIINFKEIIQKYKSINYFLSL